MPIDFTVLKDKDVPIKNKVSVKTALDNWTI
jgi:hypothetical protein